MSSPPETSELSETDPGYRSRSRSQSRRARRRKQQGAQKKPQQSMASVPEDQDTSQPNNRNGPAASSQAQAKSGGGQESQSAAEAKTTALAQKALDEMPPDQQVEAMGMQAFEWIGSDETSMNGPVTYAKAQRGEIAPRRGNPNQSLKTGPGEQGGDKDPMDQDGLKLRIELNIDVEIELKAKIQGDLTLALL